MDSDIWGKKINHGEKSDVPIKDNAYTLLTNISLGEISGDAPTFVKAQVETIELEKYDEKTNDAPTKTNTILIGVLTPNKIEQISTNQHYSPLDNVTIEVTGPNDVYISGYYVDLSEYEEEEEEEEEEEACDESQLTKLLMNAVKNDKLDEKKEE